MEEVTKARLKLGFGYAKAVNAIASGLGYGAFSFITGNLRRNFQYK